MYLRSSLHFTLDNMALAKGHSSKTKSQVSDIRTIGTLVFVSLLLFCSDKLLKSKMKKKK